MQSGLRSGVSRLDVLFGVMILAVIASIATPAVHSFRTMARSRQCSANLRQIGMALESYRLTHRYYPAACVWDAAEMILDENMRPARNPDTVKSSRANWVQALLPHLGETKRAMEFDHRVTITSSSNEMARTRSFERMKCPDDPYNNSENQYCLEDSLGNRYYFARGNYAINGGPQPNAEEPGYLAFPFATGNVLVFDQNQENFQWWGYGLAGFNKSFSLDEISNGQSTFVALDEIRAGLVPEDPRGVWGLGQIGSSVTWSHGINSDDFGPNNQLPDSDDILDGALIAEKYGIDHFLERQMPFCAHCRYSNQATARSNHDGGVNVLMLDGAVRFVSNDVSPSLWHVMHARDTPRSAISRETFEVQLAGAAPFAHVPVNQNAKAASAASLQADRYSNSIGMVFKRIPAGEFTMGVPDQDNRYPYPLPAVPHQVRLNRPYYLGIYEVTQGEYQRVMGENPSWHSPERFDSDRVPGIVTTTLPVEQVSWNDAVEFCRRLSDRPQERAAGRSYRLPTEAEWEYACRSGSSEPYPLNASWDNDNGSGEIAGRDPHPVFSMIPPSPVGSFPPNAFGIHDMRGNVFEWCEDWFLREYYSESPTDNPTGPSGGYLKTIRGWDWTFIGTQCKDFLITSAPWQKNRYIGFRVVCE